MRLQDLEVILATFMTYRTVRENAQGCDSFSRPDISTIGRTPISDVIGETCQGLSENLVCEIGTLLTTEVFGPQKSNAPCAFARTTPEFCPGLRSADDAAQVLRDDRGQSLRQEAFRLCTQALRIMVTPADSAVP